MNCEYCKDEHDGKYGSGRFCNSICARGYSTKSRRQEINNRISEKWNKKRKSLTHKELLLQKQLMYEKQKIKAKQKMIYYKKYPKECVICKYNKIVDLHHLKKIEDEEWQVSLCPNHHKEWHKKKIEFTDKQLIEFRNALIA